MLLMKLTHILLHIHWEKVALLFPDIPQILRDSIFKNYDFNINLLFFLKFILYIMVLTQDP